MVSRRRRFNREFKIETVKLVTDSDNSVPQIAVDMGLKEFKRKRGQAFLL